MKIEKPFHEGELLVQERAGEIEEGRRNGRVIANSIMKGALKFIEEQQFAVFSSADDEGNIWASLLVGNLGFMRARDDRTIEIDLTQSASSQQDPFWTNIEHNSQVGMLVIDLGTRRRLRINGRVSRAEQNLLRLDVVESFPNCPKYIQRRHISAQTGKNASSNSGSRQGKLLNHGQQAFIHSVDTFFVASAHPSRGMDASHRGGNPGFVRVLGEGRIRVPDYSGNSMFNTLGNFTVNPRAGLVFLDFEHRRTLQLIGRPEIQWDLDDPANETGGTKRYWDLEIEKWVESDLPSQIEWEFFDYSPHNPKG